MPRHPQYERQLSRSQRERDFWDDPANSLGLARQVGDRVERAQEHALAADLESQRLEQQQVEHDRQFAQKQMDVQNRNKKDVQATGAFAEISDLDPAAPDFRMHVAGIAQKYPLGMLDRGVQGLLKDYHTAASKSVGALRAAHGIDETIDPRDLTKTDPRTGAITYDHDALRALGQAQATRKSEDLLNLRAAQAKTLQEQGFDRVSATEKGVTATMTDGHDDQKLAKDQFKSAQTRREKALGLLLGSGFKDEEQKQMAHKEYEAANTAFGEAHQKMFGEPFVSELPVKPMTAKDIPADVAGAAVGATAALAPKATPAETPKAARVRVKSPDGKIGTLPANQLSEALKNGYTPAD